MLSRNQFFIAALLVVVTGISSSCKKTDPAPAPPPTPPVVIGDTVITPGVDPATANTIGFFLDDWQSKAFVVPAFDITTVPVSTGKSVTVDATNIITKIPSSIFGHNAVWWMGPISAGGITDIQNLNPHIIRFPGGNASNSYFWNAQQDQKPADAPDTYIDKDGVSHPAGYNYGKTDHNWEFTLDQYYNLLQQTGSNGIISVNYSYARYSTAANPVASAAHLAADWVRYDNGRTKYWEIGNEHYGDWQGGYRIDVSQNHDGQPEIITGDLYGRHLQVFVDSMKAAAAENGKTIYVGGVVHESPATESWQTSTTRNWNSGMMRSSGNKSDFYVVHNYFTPSTNVNASAILTAAATVPVSMLNYVKGDLQLYGAATKPIAFDEWNMFAQDAKQQVSNVSGLFAVMVLGESIKNKYGMTARWDMLNGWDNGNDHGLFSPGNEPGIAKWNPRPSFFYQYYLQKYLGDRLVSSTVAGTTSIVAYASTFTSGQLGVVLVNTSTTPETIDLKTKNFYIGLGNRFYWYSLEGSNDNGEFSRKVLVNGNGPTLEAGGPADYVTIKAKSALSTTGVRVTVPARGAIFMVVEKK